MREFWQVEIYDYTTKKWVSYGKPTSDYSAAYKGCVKLCEAGYKARLARRGI